MFAGMPRLAIRDWQSGNQQTLQPDSKRYLSYREISLDFVQRLDTNWPSALADKLKFEIHIDHLKFS